MIIVAVNGCFDILHADHVDLFQFAKTWGDKLIVGINSDESIKRLKGADRPFNSQVARAKVLKSIRYIDDVLIFEENDACAFLEHVKPHIVVKGSDYTIDTINQKERNIVEKNGGIFVFKKSNPEIFSSTKLINKMRTYYGD